MLALKNHDRVDEQIQHKVIYRTPEIYGNAPDLRVMQDLVHQPFNRGTLNP